MLLGSLSRSSNGIETFSSVLESNLRREGVYIGFMKQINYFCLTKADI